MKIKQFPDVFTIYRPERMCYDVYVQIGVDDNGMRIFQTADRRIEHVPSGQEAPRYATVDVMIAEALGEALAPREEASERHLNDALRVRDRLLTLVEANVMSDMMGDVQTYVMGRVSE